MNAIDLSKHGFVFAANPGHALEGFEGFALIDGAYVSVRVLAVSGNRELNGGLLSYLPIIPIFTLEIIDSNTIRYEYTGALYTAGATRAQMFGLLTRLENILSDDDVGSVSRSIASLLTERDDMITRVKSIRDSIK